MSRDAAIDAGALRRALRIYAITPDSLDRPEEYAAAVGVAVRAGVRVVQFRDKRSRSDDEKLRDARVVVDTCHAAGALAIVNDSVELAIESGADGVHLGPNDVAVESVPEGLIVGASAGTPAVAQSLVERGVDYLGVGAIYDARPTKENASAPRGPEAIAAIRSTPALADVPIVAIGGIVPSNARHCLDAGADGVAAIRGILGARDVRAAVRAFDDALGSP